MKENKIHYAWVICAACCVVMAATMGIASNCSSLFIKPISEDLGVSRASVSTMLSVFSLGAMITSFFAGKIFNEDNIIKIMKIAIFVMAVSFFANSMVKNVYVFYLTGLVNGVMQVLLTVMPTTFILNNWFKEKVGFALGLASMGSGLGGAMFNSLAGKWIEAFGWRATYRILAAVMLILAVPCIFFVLKLRPSDMGLTAYDKVGKKEREKRSARPVAAATDSEGLTFAEVKKMPFFYGLCICAVCLGICMNGMYSTISPRLQDLGYSLTFSANFLSIGMFTMAFGKIMLGRIFDAFGVRVGFTVANVCLLRANIGLLITGSTPIGFALVLMGLLFGVIYGAVVFPLSVPIIFGKKDYKAIIGPLSAMISLGGVIAPIFSAKVYDITGSYGPAYVINAVIMTLVTLYLFKNLSKNQKNA